MSDKLPVTIALPMDEALPERIRAVDPRVEVTHLSRAEQRAFRGGRPLWGGYGESRAPNDVTDEEAAAALEPILRRTEVLLCNPVVPPDILERAPGLRWIQFSSAGIDRLTEAPLARSHVVLTTASGIHAAAISEYIIGGMLAFAKHLPDAMRAKSDSAWRPYWPEVLEGKTLGIVGAGHIGSQAGRVARVMGMRVLAIRRSAPRRLIGGDTGDPSIDEMMPPTDLHYLLSESDYVAIATPLTPETRGLIGAPEFAAMKPTAVIVNIARGAVIDEPALIAALKSGQIAGAALDVFSQEPLPPESELWRLDNVIMTPHISGGMPDYMERVVNLLCDNLRRYLAGQPLMNAFDAERGY
jgi:phosphoglycerate dehydrogenase-like enzyme